MAKCASARWIGPALLCPITQSRREPSAQWCRPPQASYYSLAGNAHRTEGISNPAEGVSGTHQDCVGIVDMQKQGRAEIGRPLAKIESTNLGRRHLTELRQGLHRSVRKSEVDGPIGQLHRHIDIQGRARDPKDQCSWRLQPATARKITIPLRSVAERMVTGPGRCPCSSSRKPPRTPVGDGNQRFGHEIVLQ